MNIFHTRYIYIFIKLHLFCSKNKWICQGLQIKLDSELRSVDTISEILEYVISQNTAENEEVLDEHMWKEVDGASLKNYTYTVSRQDEGNQY